MPFLPSPHLITAFTEAVQTSTSCVAEPEPPQNLAAIIPRCYSISSRGSGIFSHIITHPRHSKRGQILNWISKGRPRSGKNNRTVQWAHFCISRWQSAAKAFISLSVSTKVVLFSSSGCTHVTSGPVLFTPDDFRDTRHLTGEIPPFPPSWFFTDVQNKIPRSSHMPSCRLFRLTDKLSPVHGSESHVVFTSITYSMGISQPLSPSLPTRSWAQKRIYPIFGKRMPKMHGSVKLYLGLSIHLFGSVIRHTLVQWKSFFSYQLFIDVPDLEAASHL